MSPAGRVGLVLFAHGARDPAWSAPFEAVAAAVRLARPEMPLRLAYLEFMVPDLPAAAGALCAEGCTAVQVLPLFLGSGGHLRNDVPPMIERLRHRHPGTRFVLHPAAGEHAAVVQAMAATALALLGEANE